MIATREGVKMKENERIGGLIMGKRTTEMKDMDEVERRAAKLRKVTENLLTSQRSNFTYEETIACDDMIKKNS